MATLAGVESMDFNELKAALSLTDGDLSTHASALERAGFVEIGMPIPDNYPFVGKGFDGKKPRTTLRQTAKGRTAMERYIRLLQGILDKAK